MQRILAIDFNPREITYLVANAAGDRITLEANGTVSLIDAAEDRPLSAAESAKQLQGTLAKYKRAGTKVLVSVDRNSIEFFEFTVPPASDAELPELVMVQSTMELSMIAEESFRSSCKTAFIFPATVRPLESITHRLPSHTSHSFRSTR